MIAGRLGLILFFVGTFPVPSSPASAQSPALQTAPVQPLVEAAWLLEHIDDEDVVVLHMERRSGRFEAERIAGARRLRFDEIAWEGEEGWIAEFRDADEIVAALRAAGVNRDSRVVIYGASMTATARSWVTFDLLGLGDRAFVLDGGMTAWKAVGGAVESGPAAAVERGDVVPVNPVDFRVSADWIHARLGDESLVLLDARPDDEYTGEDGGLGGGGRPGHIPGAAQLYWEELMDQTNNSRFLPRDEIASILERHGAGAGKTHVVYCMIGMRASVDYMAARMTGLDVYFYDGSWRDWGTGWICPLRSGRMRGMGEAGPVPSLTNGLICKSYVTKCNPWFTVQWADLRTNLAGARFAPQGGSRSQFHCANLLL